MLNQGITMMQAHLPTATMPDGQTIPHTCAHVAPLQLPVHAARTQ